MLKITQFTYVLRRYISLPILKKEGSVMDLFLSFFRWSKIILKVLGPSNRMYGRVSDGGKTIFVISRQGNHNRSMKCHFLFPNIPATYHQKHNKYQASVAFCIFAYYLLSKRHRASLIYSAVVHDDIL